MNLVRGIRILDLLSDIPPQALGLLPDEVSSFLDALGVTELFSATSDAGFAHRGRIRAVSETGISLFQGWPVEIPGLNSGVNFQLFFRRAAASGAQNLEPEPVSWVLDLFLDAVRVPLPGPMPARKIEGPPPHLEKLTGQGARTRVDVWGKGVLRIQGGPGGTDVRLVAEPDPFVPDGPNGAVLKFGFIPQHFLFMDNGLGMTVGDVILDMTDQFTPPEIVARGQDESWRGLSIKEASLYLPRDLPLLGDVSMGVKDLLVGFPPDNGIQLEAFLELGKIADNVSALSFQEDVSGTTVALSASGTGLERTITVNATGNTARLRAQLGAGQGSFTLPDGRIVNDTDTGWFDAVPSRGDALRFRATQTADGNTVEGAEVVYAIRQGSGALVHAPKIHVQQGANGWDNVVYLGGSPAALAGLTFSVTLPSGTTPEQTALCSWLIRNSGTSTTGPGDSFAPTVSWSAGQALLTFTDYSGHKRRIQIEVLERGQLVVGAESGIFQVEAGTATASTVSQLEATWDLTTWHADADLSPAATEASWDGTNLTVPAGALAQVALTLSVPAGGDEQTSSVPTDTVQHTRVSMRFDQTDPTGLRQIHKEILGSGEDPWGPADPYPRFAGGAPTLGHSGDAGQPWSLSTLRTWANSLPSGTQFLIIGRCCDLGSDSRNQTLCKDRAEQGFKLLTDASLGSGAIDASRVAYRGEQEALASTHGSAPADPGGQPAGRTLTDRTVQEWRIKSLYYSGGSPPSGWGQTQSIPERVEARGVDIYAVIPAATPPATTTTDDHSLSTDRRRALRPGADATTAPTPRAFTPSLGWDLKIRAKWDSPSWVDSNDSIPTLVELTFAWERRALNVPGSGPVEPVPMTPTTTSYWRVVGRFTHDARSGAVGFLAALDSPGDPNGIAEFHGSSAATTFFASALALGPALLGGITRASADSAAVRLGVLAGAIAGIMAFNLVQEGKVVLEKLEIEHTERALGDLTGSVTRFVVDYTVTLKVQATSLGVSTDKPIKLRYKRVGLEIDNDPALADWEKVNLTFDGADFSVADPGRFLINGALGRLLGVSAVRLGSGSLWFEVELSLAINLGVVKVSGATLRITAKDSGVSVDLRGLAASVSVPGVITGKGQMAWGESELSAAIDLDIIPAKLKANAALSMKESMVHLEAGVRFATGIPLGGTGLGLYGFLGRFVSNGTRNLDLSKTDPVERELDWYGKSVLQKYRHEEGQTALGLGVVVGTLPDTGFSFNAVGMLAVEFPDPSVVLTIDASLMSDPGGTSETGPGLGGSVGLKLLGLIAVSEAGLALAIRGRFTIQYLLDLKIPIAAWFPFQSSGQAGYLRVGSDGQGGRSGEPVTMTVLPGILDIKTWAYLMLEEKQLLQLGGRADLNFYGFSIGFGAGWSQKWGGGPIYLKFSASVLIGLGTRPFLLAGSVSVSGELWLIIVGIGISGQLDLRIGDDGGSVAWSLDGKFCGKVSFFFFSIEGCVSFHLGSGPGTAPPPPPAPLVAGVSLADKFERVVAQASEGSSPGADSVAWPDTVPVVHLDRRPLVAMAADSFQPTPTQPWGGAAWAGTAKVKYLYHLRRVDLLDSDGNIVQSSDWPACWVKPTHRPAAPGSGDAPPSEHEGMDLALLRWDPAPWSRNLTDGGAGLDADPGEDTGRLCDPAPAPGRHCVYGRDGAREDEDTVRLQTAGDHPLPYPSWFDLAGDEGLFSATASWDLATTVALLNLFGMPFSPGAKIALPLPASLSPSGEQDRDEAWRLPYASRAGRTAITLGYDPKTSTRVQDPELVLAVGFPLPKIEGPRETCVDFSELEIGSSYGRSLILHEITFFDRGGGLQAVDLTPVSGPDRVAELAWSSKGLQIELPEPVVGVRLELATVKESRVLVTVRDEAGAELGRQELALANGEVQGVTLNAASIRVVTVEYRGFSGTVLRKICTTKTGAVDLSPWALMILALLLGRDTPDEIIGDNQRIARLVRERAPFLPLVLGRLPDDTFQPWEGRYLAHVVASDQAWLYLSYRPPKKGAARYDGVRIMQFPYFWLAIWRFCAVTCQAADAAAADDAARQEAIDASNSAASDPVSGTAAGESGSVRVLEGDKPYKVRITWDAATWQAPSDGANPPPVGDVKWDAPFSGQPAGVSITSGQAQTFSFRTAPGGALPEQDILRFDAQSRFDPKALARYLLGFAPAATQPSHFLDDLLYVHLTVQWVDALLDRYGLQTRLRVRRTDPPPGPAPAPGDAPPPYDFNPDLDLGPLIITWEPLPIWLRGPADQRVAGAAIEAPCLDAPVDGASAGIQAPLEPDASYDLLFEAVPSVDAGGEGALIGLSHFHTSRYRGVPELLAAMGLRASPADPFPFEPLDTAVATAGPADTALGDDLKLDQAMAALGLDPWPLPREPKIVLLWVQQGGVWKLAGALLDSDEALIRPARMEPASLADPEATPPPRMEIVRALVGGVELRPRRSNANATRVLLTAASPAAVSGADPTFELYVHDRGALTSARRAVGSQPYFVTQELS